MLAILDPEFAWDAISESYTLGQPQQQYQYALRYASQRMTAFYKTSILGMGEFIGRILEMDPIFHSQRTIEDVWSFFASLTIVRESDQLGLPYLEQLCEAFLRRCTIDKLPNDRSQWWIDIPHDKYAFLTFWTLFVTTRFGDGQGKVMSDFRFENPEYIPYYSKLQNMELELTEKYANTMELIQTLTQRSKSKLKKVHSNYWLINTFLNIQHTCINNTADTYLEHLFVRTDTRKTRRFENTLNMLLPTPVVMRRFNSVRLFVADIEQLKNPYTLEIVNMLKLTADPSGCYFLLEQSALMVKLMVDYYMLPHQARFKITVLPRTSNSSYIVGSADSIRMFRQCQIVDMLTTNKLYKTRSSMKPTTTTAKKITTLKQPPVFPIIVRTWIDSNRSSTVVQNDQKPNERYLCAVGLQQVLLTLVRWCYIVAEKDLTNTWYGNVWSTDHDNNLRKRFIWNTRDTEGAMSTAMLDPNNVNFHSFYSHFFLLLERGWSNAVDLHKAILEAVLTPPNIDDYLHKGDCSLFAFFESFVFINATHMISWDVIQWLHAGVQLLEFSALTQEEAQARQLNFHDIGYMTELARNFPPLVPLANSLMQLYQIQKERQDLDSVYKYDLYEKWLVFDLAATPQREFLIHTYYMMTACSLWTSSHVRRLLLGCRLAPCSHYITTKSILSSMVDSTLTPMDVDPEEAAGQVEEKNKEDDDSSIDWEDDLTGAELMQRAMAKVMASSRPSQYDSDDDDDDGSDDDGMSDFSSVLENMHSHHSDMSEDENNSASQSSMDHSEDHRTQLHQNKLTTKIGGSGLKKRKRSSSDLGGSKKVKQRRLNNPQSDINHNRNYKWNEFTAKVTRQYITTLPTDQQQSPLAISIHTQQLVLELFATLENCITTQLTSADLESSRLMMAVTENQRFLPTFKQSNTYGVFFGFDNIGKLMDINPAGLGSQAYVNQLFSKTNELIITDQEFGDAADKIINVQKCRIFFDHEICFVPNAIYRTVDNYSIHTYQRQMLENVFIDFPLRTVLQSQLRYRMTGYYTDILRYEILNRLKGRPPPTVEQQHLDTLLMPPPPPPTQPGSAAAAGKQKKMKWKEVSFPSIKK